MQYTTERAEILLLVLLLVAVDDWKWSGNDETRLRCLSCVVRLTKGGRHQNVPSYNELVNGCYPYRSPGLSQFWNSLCTFQSQESAKHCLLTAKWALDDGERNVCSYSKV